MIRVWLTDQFEALLRVRPQVTGPYRAYQTTRSTGRFDFRNYCPNIYLSFGIRKTAQHKEGEEDDIRDPAHVSCWCDLAD